MECKIHVIKKTKVCKGRSVLTPNLFFRHIVVQVNAVYSHTYIHA